MQLKQSYEASRGGNVIDVLRPGKYVVLKVIVDGIVVNDSNKLESVTRFLDESGNEYSLDIVHRQGGPWV
jgi:hypothetical protein